MDAYNLIDNAPSKIIQPRSQYIYNINYSFNLICNHGNVNAESTGGSSRGSCLFEFTVDSRSEGIIIERLWKIKRIYIYIYSEHFINI